jgi:16S rRNA (guanine966-N2)-methyltransferase
MRIVSGTLRGRPIRTPEGLETRPTSDRARQAIFNILEHAPWSPGLDGLAVIDLFAGSGAMGLEALSRGAASCVFVEQGAAPATAITENLAALKLGDRGRLMRQDATRLAPPPGVATCQLAFLDPPYRKGLGQAALAGLAETGWLDVDGLAVLEVAAAEPFNELPAYEQVDERRYGAAKVVFLRRR